MNCGRPCLSPTGPAVVQGLRGDPGAAPTRSCTPKTLETVSSARPPHSSGTSIRPGSCASRRRLRPVPSTVGRPLILHAAQASQGRARRRVPPVRVLACRGDRRGTRGRLPDDLRLDFELLDELPASSNGVVHLHYRTVPAAVPREGLQPQGERSVFSGFLGWFCGPGWFCAEGPAADDVDGPLRHAGVEREPPDHRSHEERADEEIGDEGEVDVRAQLAPVDPSLPGRATPRRGEAWRSPRRYSSPEASVSAATSATRPEVTRREWGLFISVIWWRCTAMRSRRIDPVFGTGTTTPVRCAIAAMTSSGLEDHRR